MEENMNSKSTKWLKRIFYFLDFIITDKVIFGFFAINMVFTMIGVSALLILMPNMGLEPWMGTLLHVIALFMISCNAVLAILYKLGRISEVIEVKINWKMMKSNGGKK